MSLKLIYLREKIFKIIVLPFSLIIVFLRPLVIIRFGCIDANAFGHFVLDTALTYLKSKSDEKKSKKKIFHIFGIKKPVTNSFLKILWKRQFVILPFLDLLLLIGRVANFLSRSKDHLFINELQFENEEKIFKDKIKFNFKIKEISKGKKLLDNLNIPENSKIILIAGRDNDWAYLYKKKFDINNWDIEKYVEQQSYRNINIDTFRDAALKLVDLGYYVVRVGTPTKNKFNFESNTKIIDYANSKFRSDFGDIYLGKVCSFYFGSDSGIINVPKIFGKPVAHVGTDILHIYACAAHQPVPFIPKIAVDKETGKKIKLKNFLEYDLVRAKSNNYHFNRKNKAYFLNNSAEDIKHFAVECDKMFKKKLIFDKDEKEMQDHFWRVVKKIYPNNFSPNLKTIISPHFLKKNLDILD